MDTVEAGTTTFLEDFVEDRLRKSFSVLRGRRAAKRAMCC
jgi:hypothetical protein